MLASPTNSVAIVAARRTPQGRFLGGLAKYSATELAVHAGEAALSGLSPDIRECIDEVIIGNVLGAGLGMNIARQIAVGLCLPVRSDAMTVNMMCASGMKAIMLACDAVRLGRARVVLCGGAESMSQAPYLLPRVRSGLKLGDSVCIDSILSDGLVDAFDHQHMGLSAERLAREYSISRLEQDNYALLSQQRYQAAEDACLFNDEMVAVGAMANDEHPRGDTSLATLEKLKPAFDPDGTVTAGNASGINDGAAMLLLCSVEFAKERGLEILALVEDHVTVGCEPVRMGLGPVHAINKLLGKLSVNIAHFDTVELNEAFAAQVLACVREIPIASECLNPDGGAIALGHPIGATGARLVVHLAHRISKGRTKRGLATLCVGGGMGAAISLSNLD